MTVSALKVVLAVLFISVIAYLGLKLGNKVYSSTKTMDKSSNITRISVDLSGGCSGFGSDAQVYDFSSPQPNVPINVTIKVLPVGAPVSSLVVSEAEVKIVGQDGGVVLDKKLTGIENGTINFVTKFNSVGTYDVYLSVTTNLGSVYNKKVGSIVIGGQLASGRVPVREDFTVRVPAGGLNYLRRAHILPDTAYYTSPSGSVEIYIPLAQYSRPDADYIAGLVAKHLTVELVNRGIPLLDAISTSKEVYGIVYNYLLNSYSSGYAVVSPTIKITEKPGEYLLPEYIANLDVSGDVMYSALHLSVSYTTHVTGVDYSIEAMKGKISYPALVSIYTVYLNSTKIIEYSNGIVSANTNIVRVKSAETNVMNFEFIKPMTGKMMIYYQTPYQTPDDAVAPIILGGKAIYNVSVPIDYSFSKVSGVLDYGEITIPSTSNTFNNKITLFFTREDFVNKTVEEAVTDKLALISSSLKIYDKNLKSKVVNAVKQKLNSGYLRYNIAVEPALKLVKVDGNTKYYQTAVHVSYTIDLIEVTISFSSKTMFTPSLAYPLDVGISQVTSSMKIIGGDKIVTVPAKYFKNIFPSPAVLGSSVVGFNSSVQIVNVKLSRGDPVLNITVPTVEVNGDVAIEDRIPVTTGGTSKTIRLEDPSLYESVVSQSNVMPGGFKLVLKKSKRVLSRNDDYPASIRFNARSDAHLYGDYYIVSDRMVDWNRLHTLIITDVSASDRENYGAFTFYDTTTRIELYSTSFDTPIQKVTIYDNNGKKLCELSPAKTLCSADGVDIRNFNIYNDHATMKATVSDSSISYLKFIINNDTNFASYLYIRKVPYSVSIATLNGELIFLTGNVILLKATPLMTGQTSDTSVRVRVHVKNWLSTDEYSYLNDIVSPDKSKIISNLTVETIKTVSLNDKILVGVSPDYAFVTESVSLPDTMEIFLIPLKHIDISIVDTKGKKYFPSITLESYPAKVKSEYTPSNRIIYTFEGYETKFKMYFEYTTKNGTARAYITDDLLSVTLTLDRDTIELDPSYYVVGRDGEFTTLRISSFPVDIDRPTHVTIQAGINNVLFSGKFTVDTIELRPPSAMNNVLIVPKELSKVYWNFNKIQSIDAKVLDYPGSTTITYYLVSTPLSYPADNFNVSVIPDGVNELYFPYPMGNPFLKGLTAIGIPIPSGNSVKEIDVSYTTDYLYKKLIYKVNSPADASNFVKEFVAGESKYGLVVVPLDPLITASIVSHPISFTVTITLKNGVSYSVNYLIQPILAEYSPYDVYSRYGYILSPQTTAGQLRLYYSRMTGKEGNLEDFIANTELHEADPRKPSYTELIKHLKPLNVSAEEWLFANAYSYEDLTIKPTTSGGYFLIDSPNEVYIFRMPSNPAVAFYIGGSENLRFQFKYQNAGYSLQKIIAGIKSGKLAPSYKKTIALKDGQYDLKLWFFIPDNGVYVYVKISKDGGSTSEVYFRISGFGFSFVYNGHKFSVCWAWLTNDKVKGLVVSAS